MSNLYIANSNTLDKKFQFWAYLSPQNNSFKKIKNWRVIVSQENWSETITNENPDKKIEKKGLNGLVNVSVEIYCSRNNLWENLIPVDNSVNTIEFNSRCISIVFGIFAEKEIHSNQKTNAKFWTSLEPKYTMS
jgi:hypothetical protein